MKNIILTCVVFVLLVISTFSVGTWAEVAKSNNPHNLSISSLRPLLDCIWDQESSKQLNPKDGDGGRAIGSYQIWESYWKDAVDFDPSIGGKYDDVRKKDYAEKIVLAYFQRYTKNFKSKPTNEQLARIHNGGPTGYKKKATLKYWKSKKFDPIR
jgi:hypothetical protein